MNVPTRCIERLARKVRQQRWPEAPPRHDGYPRFHRIHPAAIAISRDRRPQAAPSWWLRLQPRITMTTRDTPDLNLTPNDTETAAPGPVR